MRENSVKKYTLFLKEQYIQKNKVSYRKQCYGELNVKNGVKKNQCNRLLDSTDSISKGAKLEIM